MGTIFALSFYPASAGIRGCHFYTLPLLWPMPPQFHSDKPGRQAGPRPVLPHSPTKASKCAQSTQGMALEYLVLWLAFLGPTELEPSEQQFSVGYRPQGTTQTAD